MSSRTLLARAVLVACLAMPAASVGAAPAAPPPARAPELEDLTLSLAAVDAAVPGGPRGEAVLDVGTLSAGSAAHGRTPVHRRVVVRLDSPSGRVAVARLEAFLGSEPAGCTIRVDGVVLSTMPRLIDAVHRVGIAVVHEIEISIPASAPEGTFLNGIEWVAESD
ncbi:MAG TPA: hypothetical protein VGS57_20905 [Thermoanaerobaculia bacterium]|jgi:hypothetical protein|nr:hypothetical protein [Thermoanaerobaculia bacterium]